MSRPRTPDLPRQDISAPPPLIDSGNISRVEDGNMTVSPGVDYGTFHIPSEHSMHRRPMFHSPPHIPGEDPTFREQWPGEGVGVSNPGFPDNVWVSSGRPRNHTLQAMAPEFRPRHLAPEAQYRQFASLDVPQSQSRVVIERTQSLGNPPPRTQLPLCEVKVVPESIDPVNFVLYDNLVDFRLYLRKDEIYDIKAKYADGTVCIYQCQNSEAPQLRYDGESYAKLRAEGEKLARSKINVPVFKSHNWNRETTEEYHGVLQEHVDHGAWRTKWTTSEQAFCRPDIKASPWCYGTKTPEEKWAYNESVRNQRRNCPRKRRNPSHSWTI